VRVEGENEESVSLESVYPHDLVDQIKDKFDYDSKPQNEKKNSKQ